MDAELRAQAFEHAMREMPKEACGLVIVVKGKATYVPCRNVSPYENMFEIHPADHAAAADRGDIVRIVHSHCYQSPSPSDVDLVVCEQTKLPWSIVSVPNGFWCDFEPKGYRAPLIGRSWAHAAMDCYSLIRDYYDEKLGIELLDFEREDNWWLKGGDMYVENFELAGFHQIQLSEIREHDVLLMQLRSPVINHGAIYLGNDVMLHHLHRRLSCREVFAGYYRKNTIKALRHNTL